MDGSYVQTVLFTFVLVTLGSGTISHAQYAGTAYVPGTAFGGATDPGAIQITEGFRLVPSVMLGERYDSNVFFAPPTPGLDRSDFISTMAPQIRGLYAGGLISLNATAAALGEYYAKNPGLSYVGTNLSAAADMSQLLSQWRPGSKWDVTEYYSYTPQPPAFLTGDPSGANSNAYVRGYQASRVNSETNNMSTNLSIQLNQTASVTGTYSNGFRKFGNSSVQQGTLLSNNYQSYGAGLSFKTTPTDSFSLNLIGSDFNYDAGGSFSSRGGTVGWAHAFSPIVSISSVAGVQYVTTDFPSAPTTTALAPTGSFNASWKDNTTLVSVGYVLGVSPSFQFQAQPLLTHTVSFSLSQVTPIKDLVLVLGANYGRGDELGSGSATPISYLSYTATGGLTYKITRQTFFGFTYNYGNFDNKFGENGTNFDRSVVQFTLTYAYY